MGYQLPMDLKRTVIAKFWDKSGFTFSHLWVACKKDDALFKRWHKVWIP